MKDYLLRRENHRHRLSFHRWRAFDFGHIGQLDGDAINDLPAQLRMCDLTTAEHQGDFDLVALFQKTPGVARFRFKIVVINSRTVLHFLEMDDVLFFLGLPRLLGLLELELAEVHDPDDWRPCSCCNFDEIQPLLDSLGQRYVYFHDAKLTAVSADDADWADPDLPVYPWRTLRGILNRPCS